MIWKILALILMLAQTVDAGVISRPIKSNGSSSFTTGMVPTAADFNGDHDTIFSEFNGNITNANINASAAIQAAKINPDGFTINVRTVRADPCKILEESDQAADAKRWAICLVSGQLRIGTYSDAMVLQNNWITVDRADGSLTLGGTAGTNIVNGATTFNQPVTFVGATSVSPTGMVAPYVGLSAPTGWLLMNGASNDCTGASAVNASLCGQLVGLFGTVNYKGTASSTVTVDTASDEVLHTGHGKSANDRVHFSSTVTLPTPLSATTVYCIISVTTDRYKVGPTCGGAATDITDAGTGTHSDYFSFVTPDARGRGLVGSGTSTQTDSGGDADVDIINNVLSVPSNNTKWITGMPVTFTLTSGTITGLTSGNTYYIFRSSSNTVAFATSLANAQNLVTIDLTAKSSPVWTITHNYSTRTVGENGGEENHAQNINELLGHTHNNPTFPAGGAGGVIAEGSGGQTGNVVTASRGGNVAMNIMSPFLVITYIIKL